MPGFPCCCQDPPEPKPCIIFEDDFEAATLDEYWIQTNGTWETDEGKLVQTGTPVNPSIVQGTFNFVDHTRSYSFQVFGSGTFFIGSFTVSSLIIALEVTIGSPIYRVVRLSASTGAVYDVLQTYRSVEFEEGFYVNSAFDGINAFFSVGPLPHEGSPVGRARRSSYTSEGIIPRIVLPAGASTVSFDNYSALRKTGLNQESCFDYGKEPCDHCLGPLPEEVTLTVSGILNPGYGWCGDCETLNGLYVLPFIPWAGGTWHASYCSWSLSTGTVCSTSCNPSSRCHIREYRGLVVQWRIARPYGVFSGPEVPLLRILWFGTASGTVPDTSSEGCSGAIAIWERAFTEVRLCDLRDLGTIILGPADLKAPEANTVNPECPCNVSGAEVIVAFSTEHL